MTAEIQADTFTKKLVARTDIYLLLHSCKMEHDTAARQAGRAS